jgi:hypothetical protein
MTRPAALQGWHELMQSRDAARLDALLTDDTVFHTPVMHSPQRGRALLAAYLMAAFQMYRNGTYAYTGETVAADHAVLEFEAIVDGIGINGVDIIRWNAQGRITEFKAMVRPLRALQLIHRRMVLLLEAPAPGRAGFP